MELCGGEHAELSSVELRKRKDLGQTAVSHAPLDVTWLVTCPARWTKLLLSINVAGI